MTAPVVKHDKYWLDDGSAVILSGNLLFKIHRSLLERLSPSFFSAVASPHDSNSISEISGHCPIFSIKDVRRVKSGEFESLLAYLYHDM